MLVQRMAMLFTDREKGSIYSVNFSQHAANLNAGRSLQLALDAQESIFFDLR